jgi:uncharacterized membrane protein
MQWMANKGSSGKHMNKTLFAYSMVVLPIVGILDAGYITYEKFAGRVPVCSAYFDCGKVLGSQWASIGPIPVSLLGVGFYVTLFILGVLLFLEKENITAFGKKLRITSLLHFFSALGFLFSLFLVFLMAFILQAWCLYCLVSAVNSTLIFILNMAMLVSHRKGTENEVHV